MCYLGGLGGPEVETWRRKLHNHNYVTLLSDQEMKKKKKASLQLISLSAELITNPLEETGHESMQHQRSVPDQHAPAGYEAGLPGPDPKMGPMRPYGGQPVLTGHVIRSSLTQLHPAWKEWSYTFCKLSVSANVQRHILKISWTRGCVETDGKWINVPLCVLKVYFCLNSITRAMCI